MQKENSVLSCLEEGKAAVVNNKLSSPKVSVGDLPLPLSFNQEEKQLCFTKQAEAPGYARAASTGMTNIFKGGGPVLRPYGAALRSGFTLIELLVVVLIIGILAAVALPQYQLVVNKSRFAKLRSVAQTYVKASEAYYLANGVYPGSFEELAVDFPAQSTTALSGYTCATTSDMYCCMVPGLTNSFDPKVTCALTNNAFVYLYKTQQNMEFCRAKPTDTQAIKLCKAIGTLSTRNLGIETPTGVLSGYDTYTISR